MMIIFIGDYFITSQVFNLVFQGEVRNKYSSDCSIYKNAKTKKKTNLANIQLSGPHAWLKETFRFEDENYQEYDFRSSQKEKQTPGKLHCTFDSPEKLALLLIEGV